MLKIGTKVVSGVDHVDLSCSDQSASDYPLKWNHGMPVWPDGWDTMLVGDEICGPVLYLWTTVPGREIELYPAHMHAADNWRISIKGLFEMGSVEYGEGDFRLQRGWKNYPGDSISAGPDGGALAIMFADRRGTRIRRAKDDVDWNDDGDPAAVIATPWMEQIFGVDVDLFSETTCEDSAIATTLPEPEKNWHRNSSFEASSDWPSAGNGTRAAITLLGQRDKGPVLVLARTQPGHVSSSECSLGTELVRLVVRGSCVVGDKLYEAGDARIEAAGVTCPAVVAGPEGVDEVLLIGDRRYIELSSEGEGWTTVLTGAVADLQAELDARPRTATVQTAAPTSERRLASAPL